MSRVAPLIGALALMLSTQAPGVDRLVAPSPDATVTFSRALAVCRFWHGGRPGHRSATPSSHPPIQACLKAHGWQADGTPVLRMEPGM